MNIFNKMTGALGLANDLQILAQRVSAGVPPESLLPPGFIQQHTRFSSLAELTANLGDMSQFQQFSQVNLSNMEELLKVANHPIVNQKVRELSDFQSVAELVHSLAQANK